MEQFETLNFEEGFNTSLVPYVIIITGASRKGLEDLSPPPQFINASTDFFSMYKYLNCHHLSVCRKL